MHGLAVYVKQGLPFVQDLSLENYVDSYLFSTSFTSLSVLLLFPLSVTFFISPNIDEVLLINPSANVFVIGDSNVHHKVWLTYSDGTDKSSELCYNFLK